MRCTWRSVTGAIEVAGLFTTVDEDTGTVAYTGVPVRLAQAQAEALALPLHLLRIPAGCPPGRREDLRRAVLTGRRCLRASG